MKQLKIAGCLLNKLNMMQRMIGSLANYFDYDACADTLFNWDYTLGATGHVFRRIIPLRPLGIKGFSEWNGSFD